MFLSNQKYMANLFGFPFSQGHPQAIKSAALLSVEQSLDEMGKFSVVRPSKLLESSETVPKISLMDSPMGKYVSFSAAKEDGRVTVSSLDAGTINEVPRGIFLSVLLDSSLVDFRTITKFGKDAYFFTKPNVWQSKEDIKALHRLGPRVNLTTHETETDNIMTMEVKVHLDDTVINIRYGTDPASEKTRLLRHAYKIMVRKMWMREKDFLLTNRKNRVIVEPLNYDWDKQQKDQLINKSIIDWVTVRYQTSIEAKSDLVYDLDNKMFVKRN